MNTITINKKDISYKYATQDKQMASFYLTNDQINAIEALEDGQTIDIRVNGNDN